MLGLVGADPEVLDRDPIYIHASDDGGIFVIDVRGQQRWVTEAGLRDLLEAQCHAGGPVLLSSDGGSTAGNEVVEIVMAGSIAVVPSPETHPDAKLPVGATTLMAQAFVGTTAVAEDLIRRGADIEAVDDVGCTALMYAALEGNVDLARLLLSAGAEVNSVDLEGSAALVYAAQSGHVAVIKTLLSAGADVALARPDGFGPLDYAIANNHDRAANILRSRLLS